MKNVDEEMGGMGGARPVKLKEVKRDGFFKLKPTAKAPVWIRGDYDRSEKKYHCVKYWDLSATHNWRGEKMVYVVFSF